MNNFDNIKKDLLVSGSLLLTGSSGFIAMQTENGLFQALSILAMLPGLRYVWMAGLDDSNPNKINSENTKEITKRANLLRIPYNR